VNYIYIAAGIALVGANIGWMAERTAHATTKATHAEYIAQAERTARALSERNRTTEQELRNAQDAHATEAAALRQLADRNRAAAATASKRLQDAAADAAARARAQCADPAVAKLRDPADDPIGMFAVVLGEVDRFAGAVASAFDESRAAGLACQREYSAAREALTK
jgi:Asp/Glu/hydantoin racemase